MTVRSAEKWQASPAGAYARSRMPRPFCSSYKVDRHATVDWTHCSQLHTAVLQVVLASGLIRIGPCGRSFCETMAAAEAF